MARVILSGSVSDIRGKVGGSVFQNSSAGIILKNKSNNINKRSTSMLLNKHLTANVSYKWLSITQADRDYWDKYSSFNKSQQKNNKLKNLSGQQLFQKYNNYRVYIGLPILIRPSYFKCDLQDIFLTIRWDAGQLRVNANRVLDTTQEFLVLFLSIGTKPTINNPGNRMRIINFTQTTGATWLVSSTYSTVFGYSPPKGEAIFMKWCVIHKLTAQIFPLKQTKTIL